MAPLKLSVMKTKTFNQEILLMTNTTFARREWCEKSQNNGSQASAIDQLEEACWNGMLESLLPGMMERTASGRRLFLWQVIPYNSFLEIELCESPFDGEIELSVNPYLFLNEMAAN